MTEFVPDIPWIYRQAANRNLNSDLPRLPETPRPVWPAEQAASPQPLHQQPQVRVELVRKYDAPPGAVEAQPPAQPAAPPMPEAPPPKPKKKYKKRPRRKRLLTPDEQFALVQKGAMIPITHHERLCLVCRNPLREAIEEEFIHWHSVQDIAEHYGIEPRTIYRHAKAVNLYDQRDRNLRFALGHIIHRAQTVRANADSVIRAVHHFARINRNGQWVEPPTHVVVSSGSGVSEPSSDPPPADAIDVALPGVPGDELPALLDGASRIEHDPND